MVLRLILISITLGLTVAHNVQLPVGVQPLSPEQQQRFNSWTPEDKQNIWELSGQYQGDIVLTESQRNGIIGNQYRWPNNEIPYVIDSIYSDYERSLILSALNLYNATVIRPRPRTSSDNDYVYVSYIRQACFSNVGRVGGQQLINLAPACLIPGTIIHEFLHALGFYHEHSSTNRDDFLTINWENIAPTAYVNFEKYNASVITSFGQPYDYGSVLHYTRTAFSFNGRETITPRDPSAVIGQRVRFSEIDIRKLALMYPNKN